jgi:hypothetical protein
MTIPFDGVTPFLTLIEIFLQSKEITILLTNEEELTWSTFLSTQVKMERVINVGRGHQTVAPPSYGTQTLSKEELYQLRIVRHNAFIRHQQNAAWMQDLLDLEEEVEEEEEEIYPEQDSAMRNQVIEILSKKINELKERNTNIQNEINTKSSLHLEESNK